MLPDAAKLDDTRKGWQIFFHWNFAHFSKPCILNKVLRVTEVISKLAEHLRDFFRSLVKCYRRPVMLENTGSCRQKPFLLPGRELFFGNFAIEPIFPKQMILKLAKNLFEFPEPHNLFCEVAKRNNLREKCQMFLSNGKQQVWKISPSTS